jgi:hypothetical protein
MYGLWLNIVQADDPDSTWKPFRAEGKRLTVPVSAEIPTDLPHVRHGGLSHN